MNHRIHRRAAVIGHPVAHSLSPVIHQEAYRVLGLSHWRYSAEDIYPDALPAFIAHLDSTWAGVSVTMPHKQAVIPMMDFVEPLADAVGAVNTILVQPGQRAALVGANTDVYGMVHALQEKVCDQPVDSVVIIGTGATAASAIAAAGELGCHRPRVVARSLGRAGAVRRAAYRLGVELDVTTWSPEVIDYLASATVVISTVPDAGASEFTTWLTSRWQGVAVNGVLLDVVYDPRPTMLGQWWQSHAGRLVTGERMLLHQAAEQVRLMTGKLAPVTDMDRVLRQALGVTKPA